MWSCKIYYTDSYLLSITEHSLNSSYHLAAIEAKMTIPLNFKVVLAKELKNVSFTYRINFLSFYPSFSNSLNHILNDSKSE